MDFLVNSLENLVEFKNLKEEIEKESYPISIYGVNDSVAGLFGFGLNKSINKKILIIAPNGLEARKIYEDIKNISDLNTYLYPEKEVFLYDRDSKSKQNLAKRIEAISALADDNWDILVTTLRGLLDKISNRDIFKAHSIEITRDGELNIDYLKNALVEMGYERYPAVEGVGQFSIRGSIIDIATATENYRIELFDTEVDSIRTFDINTQRSISKIDSFIVHPIADIIIDVDDRNLAGEKIKNSLEKSKLKSKEKDRLEEKFNRYRDRLVENEHIVNPDLIIPYIQDEKLSSIIDYIREDFLCLIEDPNKILERERDLEKEEKLRISDMILYGEAFKEHEEIFYNVDEYVERLKNLKLLTLNPLLKSPKEFNPRAIINFKMKGVTNYASKIKLFREDLDYFLKEDYYIILFGGSEKRTKRLFDHLNSLGYPMNLKLDRDSEIKRGEVIVTEGSFNSGFLFSDEKLVFINYNEIYGTYTRKKPKKRSKEKSLNFQDLQIGDYVVHEDHGIGKYTGTERLTVQGIKRDYVVIKYRGDDKLFIPVENLDLIYKYIGNENHAPSLNKLDSIDWTKAKKKAKKSIDDMAGELIELYAKREDALGYQFSKDGEFQREFEDAFIYEETEGQIKTSEEIKKDMENPKPMDRLLCADVGYGKTEVALRAAFKAVLDGKQVAFLVPTTILAQQHYNTMVERFKDFAVDIRILSRFRTKKEQSEDLKDLKNGIVDIIVGTHRILSKDVVFKDLGLLIIDEEQRFGVRHKEKLKMLKENIDTLTLTATPIPRTLQMSMIGIRDMSVIEEPPEERFPIQTYVLEYNELMVREAILKEIERGGQVYFVYNRVQSMDYKLHELRNLVPEARIGKANGQMSEKELENTMIDFINGDIDVLLCSTIIETGMDVQNANTMIITESNRLGLSQLYQLRGRIGRSSRLSYAYFTYERDMSISEVAEKRLKAIKEFTDFGSGYKIALRDLEIRGSGSILGAKQHGHMGAIGYDLYIKYLRDAISKLKGEEPKEKIETTIDLKMDSYIPKEYIEDDSGRLEIYKKISVLESEEEYSDLIDELIDRYSDIPREVTNLMDIALLKYKAERCNILSIIQKDDIYTIKLNEDLKLETIREILFQYENVNYSLTEKPDIIIERPKYPLEDLKKIVSIINTHNIHKKDS